MYHRNIIDRIGFPIKEVRDRGVCGGKVFLVGNSREESGERLDDYSCIRCGKYWHADDDIYILQDTVYSGEFSMEPLVKEVV